MKSKILSVLSLAALSLGLAACGETSSSQTPTSSTPTSETPSSTTPAPVVKLGTAFASVHGKGYVGRVDIEVKDGLTSKVTFDETFYPATFGNLTKVDIATGTETVEGVYLSKGKDVSAKIAKYIAIDGLVFEGSFTNKVITYTHAEKGDAVSYINKNSEWYWNAVKDGKVKVVKADGTAVAGQALNLASGTFKSEGKYWAQTETVKLGWKGNMEKIAAFLVGKDLSKLDISDAARATEANDDGLKTWTVGGVDTGATLTDFKDYVNLAIDAYKDAMDIEIVKSGTAYASVHGKGYVGRVDIEVVDGKVKTVAFDETFYPSTFGNLTSVTTVNGVEVVEGKILNHGSLVDGKIAKYLLVDNVLFIGSIENNVVVYRTKDFVNATEYINNNSAWYWNAVKEHKVSVATSAGAAVVGQEINLASGYFKSEGKYWAQTGTVKLGWKGNMEKIAAFLVGKDLDTIDLSTASRATEANDAGLKTWTVGGVDTGATLSDFKDYVSLAKDAFDVALNRDIVRSSEAYGTVHKSYLGKASISVKKGVVSAASLDETFYPATFGNVTSLTNAATTELVEGTITDHGSDATAKIAKYLTIGGKTFVGSIVNKVIKYTIKVGEVETDSVSYVNANAAWYWNAVAAHDIKVTNATGVAVVNQPYNTASGHFKSEGKYWNNATKYPLGWKGNMEKIASWLIGKDLSELGDMSKSVVANDKDLKTWTVDGVDTGATLTDFKDYVNLARNAFRNALGKESIKEGVSLGTVHKSYLGRAKVVVKNGVAASVSIDETFYPATFGNVTSLTNVATTELVEGTITNHGADATAKIAKYLTIGGVTFKGSIVNKAIKYTVTVGETEKDSVEYVNANAAWYWNAIEAKDIKVTNASGVAVKDQPYNTASGHFKSEGKYWAQTGTVKLGWKGNMEKIAAFLVGKDLSKLDISDAARATEANDDGLKTWTVGGVDTGATLTDFKDYVNLAIAAFSAAK